MCEKTIATEHINRLEDEEKCVEVRRAAPPKIHRDVVDFKASFLAKKNSQIAGELQDNPPAIPISLHITSSATLTCNCASDTIDFRHHGTVQIFRFCASGTPRSQRFRCGRTRTSLPIL